MSEEGSKGNKGDRGDKSNKGYHRLIVWQKAHQFAILVYNKTQQFPRNELYGLTSQLRRAALSVPANIVEGYSKSSKKETLRYLEIAKGSLSECEYYFEFANNLGLLSKEDCEALDKLRGEVGYFIFQFSSYLKK